MVNKTLSSSSVSLQSSAASHHWTGHQNSDSALAAAAAVSATSPSSQLAPMSLPSIPSGQSTSTHTQPYQTHLKAAQQQSQQSSHQPQQQSNQQFQQHQIPQQRHQSLTPNNYNSPPNPSNHGLPTINVQLEAYPESYGVQHLHYHSGRRVWVRKPNSTPTTIIVYQDQIVDDLKQLIMSKYPNSLGRSCDPADITIRIDIPKSMPTKKATGWNRPGSIISMSPDNLKSPRSPSISLSSKVLEPDELLWNILDTHFPQGMTMNESFIIECMPEDEAGSSSALDSHPKNTEERTHTIRQPQPQLPGRPSNFYLHHPHKLQLYNHGGNLNHIDHLNFDKDRSLSPISSAQLHSETRSPVSAIHRRSQSIPLNSNYIPSLPSASTMPTKSGSNNSQAILLLPKNFSLATGNSSSKKNHFDENSRKGKPHLDVPAPSSQVVLDEGDHVNKKEDPRVQIPHKIQPLQKRNTLPVLDTGSSKEESPNPGPLSAPVKNPENNPRLTNTEEKDPPKDTSKTNAKGAKGSNARVDTKSGSHEPERKSTPGKSLIGAKSATDKVLPLISVLVVEDNAINQAILGAFLRKHKIHYLIAKNGQEAVDKWKKGGIHLVIMDLQLPVKSGLEATKEIRYLERINKIGMFAEHELYMKNNKNSLQIKEEEKLDLNIFISPVIIVALTASSNSSVDRKHALMAGCNDYLTKPVNLVWLQNKITEWGCMQALINFDGWKSNKLTRGDDKK